MDSAACRPLIPAKPATHSGASRHAPRSAETIAVVQDDDLLFADGDRVQVLVGDDGSTRVQPL